MKLLSCIYIVNFISLIFFTPYANAKQIDLSVQVLPHKLTDTINDFDFNGLYSTETSIENQTPAKTVSNKGIVKGISTPSTSSVHTSFFTQIINGLNNLWSRIF